MPGVRHEGREIEFLHNLDLAAGSLLAWRAVYVPPILDLEALVYDQEYQSDGEQFTVMQTIHCSELLKHA